MKRKIYEKLLAWKRTSDGKSAVMIDGARRVGKSWIAEEFARNEYESYLLIDFSVAPKDVKRFFNDYLENLDVFFMYLLGAYNAKLTPRKSVIIFDEVQKFPRAREAIKHLVKDGRFDYIETGSLISIRKNVAKIVIPSEEYHLDMFPMDFEEFLWATGNDGLLPIIAHAFAKGCPVGAGMHRRIMDVFRQYEVVGGMPQAVGEFVSSHDLAKVDFEKRRIVDLYRADILKYGGSSKYKILGAFNAIPGALARHEWQFSPQAAAGRKCGMREFDVSFEWLKASMMVNVVYNATDPNIGLEQSSDHHLLKCYMGDTGLFISMAFGENELTRGEVQQRLLTGRLEVNQGLIFENLVAQLLRAAGQQPYFHVEYDEKGHATMEVDFLIAKSNLERRHNIVPIEVKSAGEYTTKSLDAFVSKFAAYSATPCVLHEKDLARDGDKLCLPVYMAGLVSGVR